MKKEINLQYLKKITEELEDLEYKEREIKKFGGLISQKMKRKIFSLWGEIGNVKKELDLKGIVSVEDLFKDTCLKATEQIKKHLQISKEEILKAQKISIETGIPFEIDYPKYNVFYPREEFYEKWEDIDDVFVRKILGFTPNYNGDFQGWQYSNKDC